MTDRRAVVSGASIAGLSAAFWLRRTGWQVTVVERAPEFRDGGQNIDVRGVAREVLIRMGLFDAVKARNTTETGTVFVDGNGQVTGELPSGDGNGATAKLEILRGDLARTILENLPDGVRFVHGDTITTVDDRTVTTVGGKSLPADLVVVAEGVRSATRGLVFADALVDRRELGVTMVFGTIPRTADDDDRWRWHNAVGRRQVHLRPDNHGTTRAMLAYAPADGLVELDHDAALTRLRERYTGVGWAAPRILDGFDASDDVYIDELVQIRMPSWHRGRVVLAGDAAWCVTPMGGGGASLALTSGYVLAAYLAQQSEAQRSEAQQSDAQHPDDLTPALAGYESWLRPLVDDVQTIPRGIVRFAYPQTRVGLAARGVVDKLITSRPFRPLAAKLSSVAETDRELPAL